MTVEDQPTPAVKEECLRVMLEGFGDGIRWVASEARPDELRRLTEHPAAAGTSISFDTTTGPTLVPWWDFKADEVVLHFDTAFARGFHEGASYCAALLNEALSEADEGQRLMDLLGALSRGDLHQTAADLADASAATSPAVS